MKKKEENAGKPKNDILENQVRDICKSIVQDMKKKRQKDGISLRVLESMSGVYESNIARIESGRMVPNLKTVIKLLAPMGKTLYIGNIKAPEAREEISELPEQLSMF